MNIVFGCIIWLPLMVWVLSLVQWMIVGDIDGLLGTAAICVGFGLAMLAMFPPMPVVAPIAFSVLVGTMLLYPVVRVFIDRRELRSVDVEALERTYLTLGQRPLNPASRFRLATFLWSLGMPGPALAIAEESLKQMPPQLFRDEHRQVAHWKSRPIPAGQDQPIECLKCGNSNPPSEVYCQYCGAPFLLLRVKQQYVPGATTKRFIAAWIAMVIALVGIPASTALPPVLTVLSIAVLFVLVGIVLWLAFRPVLDGSR